MKGNGCVIAIIIGIVILCIIGFGLGNGSERDGATSVPLWLAILLSCIFGGILYVWLNSNNNNKGDK